MTAARLVLTHARFLLLENLRTPIAVVSAAFFPAFSLLFFVVPFDDGSDPVGTTTGVAQLAVFAVLNSFLFTFGVGVSSDRELAWDPYVRTLPAPAWPRLTGRLLTGAASATLSMVPVVVVGALFTAATAPPARVLAGLVSLVVAGLPFLFAGLAVGYSLPVKAALPVTQVAFFPVAFAGGLFLPPQVFPPWLQDVSVLLPARGARDLVVWAVVGTPPSTAALVALACWTVATAGLAVTAYRRDEGRRFR